MTTPHPRRRFFRYSLRTLFVVVTVFCLWMGWQVKRAKDQGQAVKAIQEAGGRVTYRYQDDNPARRNAPYPYPPWLSEFLGEDLLLTVVGVYVEGTKVDDGKFEELSEHLRRLPKLRWLELRNSRVTDRGLACVSELRTLERLYVRNYVDENTPPISVTDAGFVHFRNLSRLTTLTLTNGDITGTGLKHVVGFPNLKLVDLRNTKLTDDALSHLSSQKRLKSLILSHTPITNAGLRHLQPLTGLEELFLFDTKVTDVGMEILPAMKNLRTLDLMQTNISDAGLVHLEGLINLQRLDVRYTKVTDEGVEKLQQALPNCQIEYTGKDGVDRTLQPATVSQTPQQ